jgi:hypothetical protein
MCKHRGLAARSKDEIINVMFRRTLSEIKLKRTDTTLDLSHKGKESWRRKEKEEEERARARCFYIRPRGLCAKAARAAGSSCLFRWFAPFAPFAQKST